MADLTELVLTGPRLTLRPWLPEDAQTAYDELHEDEEACRFTTIPWPYTRELATEWAARLANAGRADGTELGCGLVETATGRLVGSASLRLHGPVGDVGYLVYRSARGHGYAAEATRVLVDWGFAHGLVRVELACDVRNLGSVRTAQAAGMSLEGVSRQTPLTPQVPDRIRDVARFARLASDPGVPIAPHFPPLPPGGLSDGVIRLRRLAPGDEDAFLETDDAVSVAWSFRGEARTRADVHRRCEHAGLEWIAGSVAAKAIVDEQTGRYAGDFAVRLGGLPQVGNIGYAVHPAFRGRGYTARALRLFAPWAFRTAGLARLELGAKRANVASQRAALDGGFEPEGVQAARLRNPDGTFSDEVRFALVNPAFGPRSV
jgi:RimJ/RimL family protein N-acetyltransferase